MFNYLMLLVFSLTMPDPFAPLALYNGTWQVTRSDQAAGSKPDTLINQCAKVGHFYTCDQSVNGGPGALLVFIPLPNKAGHYYTQNIRPEGRATSRADLEIDGDRWIFLSTWDQSGHTIYYKTVNTFAGRNRIHFEQSESTNNKDWTTKSSGDEVRATSRH